MSHGSAVSKIESCPKLPRVKSTDGLTAIRWKSLEAARRCRRSRARLKLFLGSVARADACRISGVNVVFPDASASTFVFGKSLSDYRGRLLGSAPCATLLAARVGRPGGNVRRPRSFSTFWNARS